MNALILGATGWIGQNIITARPNWNWTQLNSNNCDLLITDHVDQIIGEYDVIINAAGYYGGIVFNSQVGSEILYRNLIMTANIWRMVERLSPKKFINIGSACIYPRNAIDTISETQLGDRNYHPSVKFSAMAKHVQLDLINELSVPWEYLVVSNAYGPGEHLTHEKSHFVGSFIKKLLNPSKSVKMLGTGVAVRDFIYITDVAEIICRYAELSESTCSVSNISSGTGTSIRDLAEMLIKISKLEIQMDWGDTKDDGVLYKVLNNQKMINDLKYYPSIDLFEGLNQTWNWAKNI